MLPGSHVVPINDSALKSLQSPELLADAFSEFISASSQLESSYRDLQREVGQLGTELAERNAALTRSLAENEAMRGALQQMIDSMPCGVLVLDTAESIVTINPEGRADCLSLAAQSDEPARCVRGEPMWTWRCWLRSGGTGRARGVSRARRDEALAGHRQARLSVRVAAVDCR